MSLSTYADRKVLDKLFNNTDFTVGSTYMSLHNGDPGKDGSNQVAVARQLANFNASSVVGGLYKVTNNGVYEFPLMPAVTVTHVGIWDAGAGGNFIAGGPFNTPKSTNVGDTYRVPDASLIIALECS